MCYLIVITKAISPSEAVLSYRIEAYKLLVWETPMQVRFYLLVDSYN